MSTSKSYGSLSQVKDLTAVVVQVAPGEYRSYTGVTPDRLKQIFPNKPIYVWNTVLARWACV